MIHTTPDLLGADEQMFAYAADVPPRPRDRGLLAEAQEVAEPAELQRGRLE